MRVIPYATILILSVILIDACSQTDSAISSPHGLAARGRTAAHEETLDGVNMSGDGARSPTGGAIIP